MFLKRLGVPIGTGILGAFLGANFDKLRRKTAQDILTEKVIITDAKVKGETKAIVPLQAEEAGIRGIQEKTKDLVPFQPRETGIQVTQDQTKDLVLVQTPDETGIQVTQEQTKDLVLVQTPGETGIQVTQEQTKELVPFQHQETSIQLLPKEEKALAIVTEIPKRSQEILKYGIPEVVQLTHFEDHVLGYNHITKCPSWVAEGLGSRVTNSVPANRKHSWFKKDPHLHPYFAASPTDYRGWSRGHMAPAGNYKHSQKAMDDTFYLSNIVPQNWDNNANYWYRIELFVRHLSKRFDDVIVFTGPLFLPVMEGDKRYIKYELLRHRVAVPTHLFKCILVEKEESKSLGCFVVPNKPIDSSKPLVTYQVPLKKVEKAVGALLFPQLDTSTVSDLCEATGCNLVSQERVDMIRISQNIENATTREEVEKHWHQLEERGLQPDLFVTEAYEKKLQEFI